MKIALVTGGNRGIGFEICRQLAKKGFKVILTARSEEKGREAVDLLLKEGLQVDFHQLDVINEESIDNVRIFVENGYDKLDILVNNAGILTDYGKTTLNVEMDTVRKVMETNFIGVFNLSQVLIPSLKKSDDARIINISSSMGSFYEGYSGAPAYSISKATLNALTLKMSIDLKGTISVNSVSPGWARTDMGGSNAERSIQEGADTAVWLATANERPKGKFGHDRKEIPW